MKYKIISITVLILMLSSSAYVYSQNRGQFSRRDNIRNENLKLTPQQEQLALEQIKNTYSEERYNKLIDLKETRPQLYMRYLSKAYQGIQYMERLKERDPEQYQIMKNEKKLEEECRMLAIQYKESEDESEKENLKNKIEDLVDRIFDIRHENRQKEIERLEKRLSEAKKNNDKRSKMKKEIIARRLEQLLGQQKEWMRW